MSGKVFQSLTHTLATFFQACCGRKSAQCKTRDGYQHVEEKICSTLESAFANAFPSLREDLPKVLLAPSKVSDYQCNNAMTLAKRLGMPAKSVAKSIVGHLPDNEFLEGVTTDERGFIYFNISLEYLCNAMMRLNRKGLETSTSKQETVVVDFSSPNIAKDMHVGHLRSTIIGDCICRMYEFCGHNVHRVNHVGDWGTQFGMLIAYLKRQYPDCLTNPPPIQDLGAFYKQSKVEFDADTEFRSRAYAEVVSLQRGDNEAVAAWHILCDASRVEFEKVYHRLNIELKEFGESFYRDKIPQVLQMCQDAGMVTELSDGAKVIMPTTKVPIDEATKSELIRSFVYSFANFAQEDGLHSIMREHGIIETDGTICLGGKERKTIEKIDWQVDGEKLAKLCHPFLGTGKDTNNALLQLFVNKGVLKDDVLHAPQFSYPLIVAKRDGGYTYDTTDMAAIWYRSQVLKADRVIVITDVGQSGHFDLINSAADQMGWTKSCIVAHLGFGLVTGLDGKRFRTRSSDTVRLNDLMDEAVGRCYDITKRREDTNPHGFSEDQIKHNSEVLGISAIKYCDLKQNRKSNYAFSFDKMCELEGNTALYLLYSYVRIKGVMRKAGKGTQMPKTGFRLSHPTARVLALHLCRFQAHLQRGMEELMPSRLTDFAYFLVCKFTDFYGKVQIVGNPDALLLTKVCGLVLRTTLDLLGIQVLERL